MKLYYCCCGETSRSPTGLRLLLLKSFIVGFLLTSNTINVQAEFDEEKMVKKLHAPKIVDPRDDSVILRCDYDLQCKKLDNVNWYKSDNMLYRYMPSMSTKGISFPNENDLKVDLEKSNGTHLVLRGHCDKAKNAEAYKGTYFCEVSTETPMVTDYAEATINVAIIPKENPKLSGLAPNYQVGEMLEATCNSAPSLPASELTFYLNDKKINNTRQISVENSDGSFSTKSSLSMLLERYHFPDDSLILSCHATVPDIRLERDYKTEKIAALAAHGLSLQELPSIFRSSSSSSIQGFATLVLVGFVALL